jgi:hypothetical protein
MRQLTGRITGALALAMVVGACRRKKDAATDSAMAGDMAMAGNATATPALGDTAASNKTATSAKPSASRPSTSTPTRSAPARQSGEIASGTTLVLHPSATVCTDSNKVGDVVHATVADAVEGSNGVKIPAGAVVSLKITALKRSENSKDPIDMGFDPISVEFDGHTYAMAATVTEEKIDRIRNEPKSKDVQKVATGAVVGAIAGKLIGKSTKGAVVGAAAGAAAGAGVAAATANYEGCIAQGSNMTVKLSAPVKID